MIGGHIGNKENEFRALRYYEGLLDLKSPQGILEETLTATRQTLILCRELATNEAERKEVEKIYLRLKECVVAWEAYNRRTLPGQMPEYIDMTADEEAIIKAQLNALPRYSNDEHDDPDPGDVDGAGSGFFNKI